MIGDISERSTLINSVCLPYIAANKLNTTATVILQDLLLPTDLPARTDACMMLVAVDHNVLRLFDNNENLIRTKVTEYVEKLNDI